MALIKSNSNPESEKPWFDAELRSDLRADIREATGLSASEWTDASESDEQALIDQGPHSLIISPEKPMEKHVLAITTDGEVEFVPQSEQRGVYYAHLGWYDPETGESEILKFIEE